MNSKSRPRKPERNPAHIVFPAKGPVRKVEEKFPREQQGLELAIGEKFLGALKHFEGIDLVNLQKGEEPSDLVCESTDNKKVNIQIVEVVDLQLRELERIRSAYRKKILEKLGDTILDYNGCRIVLVDSSEPPYLPSPDSNDGEACLNTLLDLIRNSAIGIQSLGVGYIRSRRTTTHDPVRNVWLSIERKMQPSNPARFELHWTGGGPTHNDVPPGQFLLDAIKSKIKKQYSKSRGQKFLLLAYSIDKLIMRDDIDVVLAQEVLSGEKHPFDEVWYMYPYAEKRLGSIIRIWADSEVTA